MARAEDVGRIIARNLGPMAARMAPQAAGDAFRRILEIAIDGRGAWPGAKSAAGRHLQRHGGSVDDAIDSLIDSHVRLASAQGFVTNLGGVAALPITIPANLAGISIVQIRMVAAIAHLRGYDLADNRVRTSLVMCLMGADEVAKHISLGKFPTSPMAVATAPVFDPVLDRMVAEYVVADMAGRVSGKSMAHVF